MYSLGILYSLISLTLLFSVLSAQMALVMITLEYISSFTIAIFIQTIVALYIIIRLTLTDPECKYYIII